MKKRIILTALALVLLLVTITPTAALANNERWGQWARPTDFSGSGQIFVTYMPDPVIQKNIWRYQGEIVMGMLDQCDWDLLAGTVFWSEHDSIVRVDDQYNISGVMRGTFSLTRPDGSGALSGVFTGKILGNIYTGDIYDQGTWHATGGSGAFEGVRAWGGWSAELHFGLVNGQETLVGPLNWSGKYQLGKEYKEQNKEITKEAKAQIKEQIKQNVKENNRAKIHDFIENWHKNQ
jgi:hypothetical protein